MTMKDKMMEEATKRMKILEKQGLYSAAMQQWKYGRPCFSQMTNVLGTMTGVLYTFEEMPELNNLKEWLEKEYDCMVYHGIYCITPYGRLMNFLYVSKYEEEWENDCADLEEGYPMAYGMFIGDENADAGSIHVEMAQGGLIMVD